MQFVKGGPDVPERLLQAREDGRVVFFCGAGISAHLPGFADLVNKLYSRLGVDPDDVQTAAIKAKRYDTAVGLLEANYVGGRREVRKEIAEILEANASVPAATATHNALLTLGQDRKGRTRLVTTNFDRLFEHVIANRGTSVECFEAPFLPVPKNRWDGLVYLHGLLPENPNGDDLNNLVVSSGDFGLAYLTECWAARFVSELFRNFVVCFVGYSIDDPVLRYMMDALAADRMLGESPPEMFAFGVFSKGRERVSHNEWRAKNVTPILYRAHWRHAYLHRTLRAWADSYRFGKESLVDEYAMARPDTATEQDDFVSRMVWALSDPSGVPARRFADLNPVPPLDWLTPISKDRFGHADLTLFGVPAKARVDQDLRFSMARRPAPYDLAPQMALANAGALGSQYDKVMEQLARWLSRHLNNPLLLLWLVKEGGRPHAAFSSCIKRRMDELAELESLGNHDELESIRDDAPDAVPDSRMRTLWRLILTGRVKAVGEDVDIFGWQERFLRVGLKATLRLELRDILTPRVVLRDSFHRLFDGGADGDQSENIQQLVDWEIVLSANHVHDRLDVLDGDDRWKAALPILLPDFTSALRDALDLMSELGSANERSDLSYSSQPSISEHSQNERYHDWTALVELNRDSLLATAAESPDRARLAAELWSQIPYPLFRRLALFAAAQGDIVPNGRGIEWLLGDDGWWLWSIETQRESIRLLVALAPRLRQIELSKLERAVLAGPPREMYKPHLEEERWAEIQGRDIWLRLAKLKEFGANLSSEARQRLDGLSERYPYWELAEDQSDEFPIWTQDSSEARIQRRTPRERDELLKWLRENPEHDEWRPDDWPDRLSRRPGGDGMGLDSTCR